jgi:thiamine-monophosphate kinase
MTARATSPNENALLSRIERAFKIKAGSSFSQLALSIGDDAALLKPKSGCETILTCDWFLEGTHFLRDKHPADSIGWKCLARAVSDIAAMGGAPRCFLLSLALPQSHTKRWLDQFLGGLRRASRKFSCPLAGGDTTKRKEILINITVVGEVRSGQAVRRSGAKRGDIIYVSGRLGEAEAGLARLRSAKSFAKGKDANLQKHLYPEPRLALGAWLAKKQIARAMMDLSDGLSSDLPRLCNASNVGALIDTERVPSVRLSDAEAKRGFDPLQLVLHGGDDYELLFTVPRKKTKFVPMSFQSLPLTAIGEIISVPKILLRDEDGRELALEPRGWDPFRRGVAKK